MNRSFLIKSADLNTSYKMRPNVSQTSITQHIVNNNINYEEQLKKLDEEYNKRINNIDSFQRPVYVEWIRKKIDCINNIDDF